MRPLGRRVRECTFCNVYICIGYMLPTFGEQMSVDFIHCHMAQLSGAQQSTFSGWTIGPRTVGPQSHLEFWVDYIVIFFMMYDFFVIYVGI